MAKPSKDFINSAAALESRSITYARWIGSCRTLCSATPSPEDGTEFSRILKHLLLIQQQGTLCPELLWSTKMHNRGDVQPHCAGYDEALSPSS